MLSRLIAIIYILMSKETVTAGELAERFEVSTRTIYRDVETLSMAGIPVYARKGKNGGISLTEQFVLNKMLVTEEEQREILAALTTLEETGAQDTQETLRKLQTFFRMEPGNWVAIDFSDWSNNKRGIFSELKSAILTHHVLQFDYYGQYRAMSSRTVEPVQLLFKDYTWYVWGYCRTRQAMRIFKVQRMKRMEVLEEIFLPDYEKYGEEVPVPCGEPDEGMLTEIKLRFDASEAYRIYDYFDEDNMVFQEDGSILVRARIRLDDWWYGFFLSFGERAAILEPSYVRAKVRERLEKMLRNY